MFRLLLCAWVFSTCICMCTMCVYWGLWRSEVGNGFSVAIHGYKLPYGYWSQTQVLYKNKCFWALSHHSSPCNFILINYLALSILLWQWKNELMRKCDRRQKGQNSVPEQLKMGEICSFQFSTKEELRASKWPTWVGAWAGVSLTLLEQQAHCMPLCTYLKWWFRDAKGEPGIASRDRLWW